MSKRKRIVRGPAFGASGGSKSAAGGANNPGAMMQQIQQLQQQVLEAQQQLEQETVTATAGGGVVKVTITGDQRCKNIEIDPEVLKDADVDLLQDLLVTALNSALDQSRKLAEERLGPLSSGLGGLGLG